MEQSGYMFVYCVSEPVIIFTPGCVFRSLCLLSFQLNYSILNFGNGKFALATMSFGDV